MPAAAGTDPVNLEWQAEAACASSDPELWFPGKGVKETNYAAKLVCNRCPVKSECLDYALRLAGIPGVQLYGNWGGLTEQERRSVRNGRRTCAHCWGEYTATRRNDRFCSEECRAAQRAESLANKDRRYDQFSRTGP